MQLSDFNYNLPKERIAQFPPLKRGSTKLLVQNRADGAIEYRRYADLINYINPGDVVVLNDTKVIKARLVTHNQAGQIRELLLLEYHANSGDDYHHQAIYRGRLTIGEELQVQNFKIRIENVKADGVVEISSKNNLLTIADKAGTVPLPPYMKRAANYKDIDRYQTVFAEKSGSVAAPTASLNFTNKLKQQLESKGVKVVNLTLHVGMGTFLPMRVDNLAEHKMHSEYFEIPSSTVASIKQAKQFGGKIIAIGTTVTRTLEFTAAIILRSAPQDLIGEADIFIYPGYKFRVVDALLTNFHAPKSTVLMMAAAFDGWENLKSAYQSALNNDFQFLSYGDSMLIL